MVFPPWVRVSVLLAELRRLNNLLAQSLHRLCIQATPCPATRTLYAPLAWVLLVEPDQNLMLFRHHWVSLTQLSTAQGVYSNKENQINGNMVFFTVCRYA